MNRIERYIKIKNRRKSNAFFHNTSELISLSFAAIMWREEAARDKFKPGVKLLMRWDIF